MGHQQGLAAALGLNVMVSFPGRAGGIVPVGPAQIGGVVDQPGVGKHSSQQIGGVGEHRVVAGLGAADGPALDPFGRSGAPSARTAFGVVDIGGIHQFGDLAESSGFAGRITPSGPLGSLWPCSPSL